MPPKTIKLTIGQVFLLQKNNLFTIEFFISCQVNTNCRSCTKEHNIEVGQALFAAFFMQMNVMEMQQKIITFSFVSTGIYVLFIR